MIILAHAPGTVPLRIHDSANRSSPGAPFEYRGRPDGDLLNLSEGAFQLRLVELLGAIDRNLSNINRDLSGRATGQSTDDAFDRTRMGSRKAGHRGSDPLN